MEESSIVVILRTGLNKSNEVYMNLNTSPLPTDKLFSAYIKMCASEMDKARMCLSKP